MGRGKESLKMPLNKAQIEILRLLSRDLDENDLKEIKRRIVQYLGEKLDKITGKVWEEKGLTPSDMEKILDSHHRTSYNES